MLESLEEAVALLFWGENMGELISIAICNTFPTITSSFHMWGGELSNLTEISLPLNCSEVDPNPTYIADWLKTSSEEKEKKKNF